MLAALRWSVRQPNQTHALALVGTLWRSGWMYGHLTARYTWLRQVLDCTTVSTSVARVTALHGAGWIAPSQGATTPDAVAWDTGATLTLE